MKQNFAKIFSIFLVLPLFAVACSSPLGNNVTGGGVYRTTNFGTDWEKLNKAVPEASSDNKKTKEQATSLAETGVTFLKFAPDNSKKIYAGTVDKGLFMSDDGGDSWKVILSTFIPHGLVFDPTDSSHLYASGKSKLRGRVLESKDGGKSWNEVFQDGKDGNSIRGIALNPNNPKVIVLALLSGHIMRSTDGGLTWEVSTNLQDELIRMEWAVGAPLYVLGKSKGVFQSFDAGISFNNTTKVLWDKKLWAQNFSTAGSKSSTSPQVGVPFAPVDEFFSVAVKNGDVNNILLSSDQGVFISYDAGNVWQYLTLPVRVDKQGFIASAVSFTSVAKQIYVGLGNVVYFSENSGETWKVGDIATNTQINYILVDPNVPQLVFAGMVAKEY